MKKMSSLKDVMLHLFRNEYTPDIVKYIIQKETGNKGAYISEIADELEIAKSSVFSSLGDLEKAQILKHYWEVDSEATPPKALKIYRLNEDLPNSIKKKIRELTETL